MKLGVIFPQTEIGADPVAVRDYAQAAEQLGYDHLAMFEHVLGGNPKSHPEVSGRYTHKDMFHEPFALLGYLAAVTQRIELATDVLVLPQRQTVLVAKQAAEVDVLSGGRLRLGIGIGWNTLEYEALGERFNNRGRRIEEQVAVLRALWTQELVTFEGRWHRITDASINPLPVQRPIPIWMGGSADPVLRRIVRMADGWFAQIRPDEAGKAAIDRLFHYAEEEGRDPATIGIETRVGIANGTPDDWASAVETWRSLGATHVAVTTMRAGLGSPGEHIEAIRRFKEAVEG